MIKRVEKAQKNTTRRSPDPKESPPPCLLPVESLRVEREGEGFVLSLVERFGPREQG
jgi:hypothetical protein